MNDENRAFSRRDFLVLSGLGAGVTAAAMAGCAGWADNERKLNPDSLTRKRHETDVLVIGGGMAGLFAAVKAHDAGGSVLMVSKGRLGASGQTPFAKGIFSFEPAKEKMSLDEFVEQVSVSAMGTNNPVYTKQMAADSKARVAELSEWGFFTSPLYNNAFRKPIDERKIPVVERVMITHLLRTRERIAGAAGFDLDEGTLHVFSAKSVILCTGAGGFKPNGFPICDLTHDGTMMAYRIGARVTGKEWNDGHPGQMNNPAACYDGWHGMFDRTPGVTGVGIRHDLGVELNYQVYRKGSGVRMGHPGRGGGDVTGGPKRPEGFAQMGPPDEKSPRRERPPGGKQNGPPGAHGRVVGGASAGMSIHKSEGLVPINDQCESDVPGLYAAGDALGSHMAGGIYTQIGSSLAGSAVQGAVAGKAAARFCTKAPSSSIPATQLKATLANMVAPLKRSAGFSPAWVTQTLQGIMVPNFVLYIKKGSMLRAALAYVEELRDHHVPLLRAGDMHELRLVHETANMIESAEMKLRASLMRKESRCSHYRLDYPEVDDHNWRAWINIYKDESGQMKLEKQPFGSWPGRIS